jgi:hypothetical protein
MTAGEGASTPGRRVPSPRPPTPLPLVADSEGSRSGRSRGVGQELDLERGRERRMGRVIAQRRVPLETLRAHVNRSKSCVRRQGSLIRQGRGLRGKHVDCVRCNVLSIEQQFEFQYTRLQLRHTLKAQ